MRSYLTLQKSEISERESYEETRNALADYIRMPACKRLINRILTEQSARNLKSIVVLSQFPGEGKTLFISALALGFVSLLNKRVLIMDTVSQSRDESFYYRQVLSKKGKTDQEQEASGGHIDLITTRNLDQDSFKQSEGNLPVPHNSSENYDTADFQVAPFVDSLKDQYDLILMDTCALSEVDKDCFDPLILAMYADASVIVASPETLDRDTVASLTAELKRHRVTPLGFVLNTGAESVN